MRREEIEALVDEAFGHTQATNARELMALMRETLQQISTRSIQAAQDHSLEETELRVLLEDICLDAGNALTNANKILGD